MNTGLGLSFLRIVNEEGSNGWAQVYARIPFDNTELLNKGALFGVIFGIEKENWAERDAELMGWVEEYFNKAELEVEMSDFYQKWSLNYPDLAGVWIWVIEKEGVREVSMVRKGEVGIALLRKDKEFDFSGSMLEGKVAKGKAEDGDRIALWTDGLPEKLAEKKLMSLGEDEVLSLNEKIQNESFASAGILLSFQKYKEQEKEEVPEDKAVVATKEVEMEQELVGTRYVGPLGLKEKMSNGWMKLVERKPTSKRRRWAVSLGILFLVLLLVSIISGSIKIQRESEIKKWKEFSEPIEKSLSEAMGLVQLNPSGARKLVEGAKAVYQGKDSEFSKSSYTKELGVLEKKIEDTWVLVSGEKESQIEELARVDLVRQGFKGDRMGLIKDKQLVILDGSMGVIVTVDTGTKEIKVIAGKGESLGWIDTAGDSGKMIVLNASGVRNAIDGQDLIRFDAAIVKPIAMGKFGGNIYILDQGNNEIFRYAAVGDGFGERARWLKQGQAMSNIPVDMAIDSDIWTVSENGQVEKFRRGNKEQFSLSGLMTGMKISKLTVEIEGDRIALLDDSSGAVAICSKSLGTCSQLLKSQKLREAKDIEFDGQGNLLVLLPGVVGVLK